MTIKKKNKISSLWNEMIWMCIVVFIVSILTVLVFHLYEIDLSTMIYVQEDACGVATTMHDYIVGINSGHGLSVFMQSIFSSELEGAFLHRVGNFICCLVFRNFGTAVNFYYFSGYIMVALGMYLAMRFIHIESWIALCASVLYTFLPYHYLRGESHIFLACYYVVPLACAVIARLMETNKHDKIFYVKCGIISILMGITDIYYSVFWAIILLFVCIYILVKSFDRKKAAVVLGISIVPFGCIGAINIPYLYSSLTEKASLDADFVVSNVGERTLWDLLTYGMRVSQLVFPIQNHRIKALATIRENLDHYLGNDETRMVSLGIIMSIGFIISACIVLLSVDKNEVCVKLKKYGLLNIFIVLVAGTGGLNIFVGLISTNIRCYNRMSIFIAAFSLMTLAEIVQHFWKNWNKSRMVVVVVCVAVLFGVWDQTVPFSRENYIENWELDHNIKTMVQEIDSVTKENAKILMFPFILEGEDAIIHNMRNYEQVWPECYSDNLKWINGRDEEIKQWLSAMSVLPPQKMLEYILTDDIDGIWLDENGYEEIEFEEVKKFLDENIGEPIVVSETGKQFYYSLDNCRAHFLDEISEQEESEIVKQNNIFKNAKGYYVGAADLQVSGNAGTKVNNIIILHEGELQYGPYIMLMEGQYQIDIVGDNLQETDFIIQSDYGAHIIDYSISENNNDKCTVTFDLDEMEDNVEFVLVNNQDQSVKLNYYYISALN